VEKVVTKEVEKVVTQEVEKVVKETVEVEKEVTRVVEKEVEAAPEEKVTLLIHTNPNDSFSLWFEEAWEQDVGGFRAEHPNIEQKLEVVAGWTNEYFPKVLSHVAAGTLGDIVWTPARHQSNFGWALEYNIVRDLMPLIDATNYDLDQFFPGVVDIGGRDGKFFFMPALDEPTAPLIAYNADMVAERGLPEPRNDWDYMQLTEWAAEATTDDVWGYHTGHMAANSFSDGGNLRQFGARIVTADGKTVLPGDSKEAVIKQLQWRHDLIYKHGTMPQPDPEFDVALTFAAGKVLAFGIWPVWVNKLREVTVADKFELGFIYTPLDKQGAERRTLLNDHTFAATTATEHPEEAFEWLKWNSSKEMNVQGMLAGRRAINGRPDVFEDERVKRFIPTTVELLKPLMENIEADFFLRNYRGWEFDSTWQAQTDLVLLDKIDIEEAVDNIKKNCQAVVDKEPA
jgi:multiple sugar transport system substrate-binding protein